MTKFADSFIAIKELYYKLKGIKPAHEDSYFTAKIPRQTIILKLYLCICFLQAIITFAVNPKDRADSSYYTLRALEIGIILLISFMHWRKRLSCENLLFLINCSTFFLISEYLKKNIDAGESLPCFLIGLLIEIQAFSMILARVDVLKATIFILVTNSLCGCRYLPFDENSETKFFPIVHIILNTLFMITVSYINERNDRKYFYTDREKTFSLNCFKELITEVIPNPILIVQKEDILFANEEALITFNCRDESELLDKFKKITIDSKSESLLHLYHESFEKENKTYKKKEIFNDLSRRDMLNFGNDNEKLTFRPEKELEKFTLSDLLKTRNSYFDTRKSFLKFFLGAYNKDNETNHLYFDIKLTNLRWEEKEAIMIIFTENKTIQEIKILKQQSLYKDNLLATVSHDLRTPLNGIIGMLCEVLEMISDKIVKKNLNIALRSAKYLLFMINDILDYYQISNGKLRLNYEYFSLWDTIHEVSKLIKFQAKLKGLTFLMENKLSEKKRVSALIRSDPNRLKQVILNLLGNALKFTTKGSITISLEEAKIIDEEIHIDSEDIQNQQEINDSSCLIIKVTDTGIGIKKEDQGRLFKLFGKIDNSSTNSLNKAGIGLGLSISQNIVKILNNNMKNQEIKVVSEPGQGSCFYFPLRSTIDCINEENFSLDPKEPQINDIYINYEKLPKKECEQTPLHSDASFLLNDKGISLLIVDDDQINLLIAGSYLKSEERFKYDTACNGLQALEKIKEMAKVYKFYDIILMDCNMPVMDGFEATRIIRDLIKNKTLPEVVIIACTANTSKSDIDECSKHGMNDYITKPFSKKDLVSILSKQSKKLS